MKRKLGPRKAVYALLYRPDIPLGLSPYRLFDGQGVEIKAVNEFLDAQATRDLSPRSLRSYGYSLLNFWVFTTICGRVKRANEERSMLRVG